jgi:hypothetical protein
MLRVLSAEFRSSKQLFVERLAVTSGSLQPPPSQAAAAAVESGITVRVRQTRWNTSLVGGCHQRRSDSAFARYGAPSLRHLYTPLRGRRLPTPLSCQGVEHVLPVQPCVVLQVEGFRNSVSSKLDGGGIFLFCQSSDGSGSNSWPVLCTTCGSTPTRATPNHATKRALNIQNNCLDFSILGSKSLAH